MAELKMTLGTGEEITLSEFGHEHLVLVCADLDAFRAIEDQIRAEGALETATVTDDGQTIAVIHGAAVSGAQTVGNTDGTVTGHFYLTGSTYDLDMGDYATAGHILLGEEAEE